jgi:hypothetical protein
MVRVFAIGAQTHRSAVTSEWAQIAPGPDINTLRLSMLDLFCNKRKFSLRNAPWGLKETHNGLGYQLLAA